MVKMLGKANIIKKIIAVVEDEPDIMELIRINLERANFHVKEFYDGESFIKYLKHEKPDMVILDLMLPGIDGLDILKTMKENNSLKKIPVIISSAKSDETDRILGLELGADDYVTKPFSVKELITRVKVHFRKYDNDSPEETIIKIENDLEIDLQRYEAKAYGKSVDLTATEFKILVILARKKGLVFSREQILNNLHGNEKMVTERTIDVHITKLREKLGKAGKHIINIRGIGYKVE